MAKREHHNDPNRYSAPWIDKGLHKTRTAGTRRLWLYECADGTFICAIAGEGSTWGETEQAAILSAQNW